jgi:hypothetical protein
MLYLQNEIKNGSDRNQSVTLKHEVKFFDNTANYLCEEVLEM